MAVRKCKRCRAGEAVWAYQPDLEAFYTLGFHQRGFEVIPVCEDCRAAIRAEG